MKKRTPNRIATTRSLAANARKPLSALLSQVLVASTVEFDGEFERQMGKRGHAGVRLSMIVWSNLVRFVPGGGVSVRELTEKALADPAAMRHMLGCLERWRIITLRARSEATRARELKSAPRDGWGSGRGINGEFIVQLTSKGEAAAAIWPPLFKLIEQRWTKRFGADEIGALREFLREIIDALEVELPQGFVSTWERKQPFPPRVMRDSSQLPLPTLLSQALLAFAMEFERGSTTSLALCANALRVLGEAPIPEKDISRLTGSSPETAGIGWQLKPYIAVEPDPTKGRGKLVRLSPRGLVAQESYDRLTDEIEKRWESRFGKKAIQSLRESLEGILSAEHGERLAIVEGLIPPAGTVRAGDTAPALGRRDIGSAAKQRARDVVAQTEAFVNDPAGALPHYPLWDMNRGFGP
jgi:hypothetical protein